MVRVEFRLPTAAIALLLTQSISVPAVADLWGISTEASYSRVIRFDPETGAELSGGILSGSAGLSAPGGITVGPDGKIYVSSIGTAQVLFYSCDDMGNCAPESLPGGDSGVFAFLGGSPDPASPAQLRFGPDGNLYVSELFGQKVRAYDPATGTRLADGATNLAGAGGLAFADDGDLLVGTTAVQDPPIPATISRFDQGQAQSPFFVASLGELQFPASLLWLPNGDLLAVDLFADKIERFGPNGEHLGTFANIPTIQEGLPSFPADIVFDPDGNLIVAVLGPTHPNDPGGNQGQLLRYDLDGNLLETIASGLEQIGGLAWTPSASTVAGDYDGNGFVEEADFDKWRADFGKWVAPGNGADGNGDGIVDAADYTYWRDILTSLEMGAGAGAAVVPEPSTLMLLAWSVLWLGLHWCRRR